MESMSPQLVSLPNLALLSWEAVKESVVVHGVRGMRCNDKLSSAFDVQLLSVQVRSKLQKAAQLVLCGMYHGGVHCSML